MIILSGYTEPYEIRPNIEFPDTLVTVFDAIGLPVFTTHDRDVAETIVAELNQGMEQ